MNAWDGLFTSEGQSRKPPGRLLKNPPGEGTETNVEVGANPVGRVSSRGASVVIQQPAGMAMRILRKHGRPLLVVPPESQIAERCLDLYPAQTPKARMAKRLLRVLWKTGWLAKTERSSLPFAVEDAFARYMTSLIDADRSGAPKFGILAGNPAGGTQRFLVLTFDAQSKPVAVIKAGLSAGARSLVQAESEFFTLAPKHMLALPRFISKFEGTSVDAFATEYCAGDSPNGTGASTISAVLTSWLDTAEPRPLEHFPELAAQRGLGKLPQAARTQRIHTCIQHGDFAPWNIKVSPQGKWTVLDWERGKTGGLPGWDWFHYVIQTGILVEKRGTEELVNRIKTLIASEPFKEYARKAGIQGLEKLLVGAYLSNLIESIKPAEGLNESRALLEALSGHTF